MSEKLIYNIYTIWANIYLEIKAESKEEAIEEFKERNKDAKIWKVSDCKVPELLRAINNNSKQNEKGENEKNE